MLICHARSRSSPEPAGSAIIKAWKEISDHEKEGVTDDSQQTIYQQHDGRWHDMAAEHSRDLTEAVQPERVRGRGTAHQLLLSDHTA